MILKLTDKTEVQITTEQAVEIEKMLASKVEFIKIENQTFKRSTIAGIFKGNVLTEVDIKRIFSDDEDKYIEAPSKCRGQHSIQAEINTMAYRSGKDWAKKIRDKEWRERTRLDLRDADPNKKWCDYKADECACEFNYLSKGPGHEPERILK